METTDSIESQAPDVAPGVPPGQDGLGTKPEAAVKSGIIEETNHRPEQNNGHAETEPQSVIEEGDEIEAVSAGAEGTEQKVNGSGDTSDPTTTSHRRTASKVEVIEAPNRSMATPVKKSSEMGRSSSTTTSSSLRPEPTQHRHDPRMDQPSSYQPSPPHTYLHLRAVALQLPNNVVSTSNASHTDPPTVILEGRTNLSSARRSFYPKVTRTLPELHLWLLALTLSFPASIFSPFTYPLATLMNGGPATDSAIRNYLVSITNQLGRILTKPYVLSHPATIALVDCDFSYTPTLPHVGPGSSAMARKRMEEGLRTARSGFDPLRGKKGKANGVTSTWDVDGVAAALGLPTSVFAAGSNEAAQAVPASSKNPLSLFTRANASPQRIQVPPPVALPPGEEDEDEEDLTLARNEITRLEMQFEKASQAAQMVLEKSGGMTATLDQLSQALSQLDRLDAGRIIPKRSHEDELTKIMIKGIEGWSAAEAGAISTIVSTITPSLSYQSYNARMAIDALLRRASAATHRHSALVVLVQKRREAERLKRARGEIRQEEVDWILAELKEAQRTTQLLTHHLATFTSTLKDELKSHSRFTHSDVQGTLLNHARNSIRAHKYMLSNLKRARDDLVAKREGKPVQSVEETPSVTTSGLAHIETAAKEEIPTPVVEHEIRSDSSKVKAKEENAAVLNQSITRSDVDEADQIPATASVTSTMSTDKELPIAPVNDTNGGVEDINEDEKQQGSSKELQPAISSEESEKRRPLSDSEGDTSLIKPTPLSASDESQRSPPSNVTRSGFLPPTSPQSDDTSILTQSAFLPARNMERYANPFARLDPSLPSQTSPPSLVANNPATPKAKVNDVWANRSRLSASDAARSLAGRF